jgi:hypothetical protein
MLVRVLGRAQPASKETRWSCGRSKQMHLSGSADTQSRGCPLVETPEGEVPEPGRLPRPRVRYIRASARFLVARAEGGRR